MKALFGPLLLIFVGLTACDKSVSAPNPSVEGHWSLQALQDPFSFRGDTSWQPLPSTLSRFLTFSPQSHYTSETLQNGALETCTGTYSFSTPIELVIQTTCATENDTLTLVAVTDTSLILQRRGTEGPLRYQYRAQ